MRGMHLTHIGNGHILLEPGDSLDPANDDAYLEPLMTFLQEKTAARLIYDLKDVPLIDSLYYAWLKKLNKICVIGGVKMIVVNMQPTAAFSLASTLGETPPFTCALDVDQARKNN